MYITHHPISLCEHRTQADWRDRPESVCAVRPRRQPAHSSYLHFFPFQNTRCLLGRCSVKVMPSWRSSGHGVGRLCSSCWRKTPHSTPLTWWRQDWRLLGMIASPQEGDLISLSFILFFSFLFSFLSLVNGPCDCGAGIYSTWQSHVVIMCMCVWLYLPEYVTWILYFICDISITVEDTLFSLKWCKIIQIGLLVLLLWQFKSQPPHHWILRNLPTMFLLWCLAASRCIFVAFISISLYMRSINVWCKKDPATSFCWKP